MKVLWITNILLPEICKYLGKEIPVIGGWMSSSLDAIKERGDSIQIAVASVYKGKVLLEKEINGIIYYCIPSKFEQPPIDYDKRFEKYWIEIKTKYHPDIVHIHGSEFQHGLAYIKACGKENVVLSIQGCVSVIRRYALAGIEHKDWITHWSFHDLVKLINPRKQIIDEIVKRSYGETRYFKELKYVIGRTDWDRIHSLTFNQNLSYFFCSETLRPPFYENIWDKDKCVKHRIFLSQANTPIKGLYHLIKSFPYVLHNYPDAEIFVAGSIPINNDWKRRSTYGNILLSLLNETGTKKKVYFTGPLNESEMVRMYLSSNVFVCPSSIENSPNSLGEAQLLGIPCVASYVGGIPSFIKDRETGLLYRFEEYEQLADHICEVFGNIELAQHLSYNSRQIALHRHNKQTNAIQITKIYSNILNNDYNNKRK